MNPRLSFAQWGAIQFEVLLIGLQSFPVLNLESIVPPRARAERPDKLKGDDSKAHQETSPLKQRFMFSFAGRRPECFAGFFRNEQDKGMKIAELPASQSLQPARPPVARAGRPSPSLAPERRRCRLNVPVRNQERKWT